jgi:hypothetical protein
MADGLVEVESVRRALSRFVSRNAHALSRIQCFATPRETVEALHDYILATGRDISRCTNLTTLVNEAYSWHVRFVRTREVEDPLPSIEIPRPPMETWRGEDVEIVPITSLQELSNEGLEMHNCVVSFACEIAIGWSYIYHATIKGKPLTVEVRRCHSGWTLGQVSGFANEPVEPDQRATLNAWLNVLRACAHPE